MAKGRPLVFLILGLSVALVAFVTVPTLAADITKISKEELKSMLGNPDVIILDVNPERRWKAADRKILGAFREDPKDVESWMNKYTIDKTLVLYCA